MTNIEKATEYIKFRNKNDYHTKLYLSDMGPEYECDVCWVLEFTSENLKFYTFESLLYFLAQCYDDEREAGNIKEEYESAKIEILFPLEIYMKDLDSFNNLCVFSRRLFEGDLQ